MASEERYFSRAWALLTHDKGWIKPVLVLTCVPFGTTMVCLGLGLLAMSVLASSSVVGLLSLVVLLMIALIVVASLVVSGYVYEWARLTAWGVDASPKQKGVRVGECIRSGGRVFAVGLLYSLIVMAAAIVVSIVLAALLGSSFAEGLLMRLLYAALTAVAGIVVSIASLRATIYQRFGAGMAFSRIWELVRADYVGVLKLAGISCLLGLAASVAVGVLAFVALIPLFSQIMAASYAGGLFSQPSVDAAYALSMALLGSLDSVMVWCAVIAFVSVAAEMVITLVTTTAVALWMRQFNVPAWGGSNDPLPVRDSLPAASAGVTPSPVPDGVAANTPSAPPSAVAPGTSVADATLVAPSDAVASSPSHAVAADPAPASLDGLVTDDSAGAAPSSFGAPYDVAAAPDGSVANTAPASGYGAAMPDEGTAYQPSYDFQPEQAPQFEPYPYGTPDPSAAADAEGYAGETPLGTEPSYAGYEPADQPDAAERAYPYPYPDAGYADAADGGEAAPE